MTVVGLNTYLLKAGFDIGPTVNPQTKGIYIWGSPIEYKTSSGEVIKIIMVDTEGIGL